MAGRVVTMLRRNACALGFLLLAPSACGSFNPVAERKYALLDNAKAFMDMGIQGPHWVVYDDQHSRTGACTNAAAGNHLPSQCSHLDRPSFGWDGGACPDPEKLQKVNDTLPKATESICIQGAIGAYLPCSKASHCLDSFLNGQPQDTSNMWGAGVGLSFSIDGKQAWNPADHGVTGIAFDLELFPQDTKLGDNNLNLRVQIPSILSNDEETNMTYNQLLLTEDGSVVDSKGNVYPCNPSEDVGSLRDGLPGTLANVSDQRPITSEQHPYGSSFWQDEKAINSQLWGPSPVEPGHNEFELTQVASPPSSSYTFDSSQILGVHFQVAHPQSDSRTTPYPFAFCIKNLAFLTE